MKKIKQVDFSHFKNNEHGQFHKVIRDELTGNDVVNTVVIKFSKSYVDAVTAELLSIEVEQGSQHTGPIEDSDLFRDRLYRAFVLQIKSGLLSYEPTIVEGANRIMRIINQVGDMRKQPYNQESGTLTSFVNQLENNYSDDINLCNAALLFTKLKEANNSFIANFGTRSTEAALRISGDVRVARAVTDPVFKDICSVINAMVLLNGEGEYSDFIDKVNYQIDYYKNTINTRHSKGKDDKDNSVNPS
jgi:hypothetical protein